MRQLITTFIAWTLVASLLAACGSGPEKKAEDVASQRVRTTSRVWTAPPEMRRARSTAERVSPPGLGRLAFRAPVAYSGRVPPAGRPASPVITRTIPPRRG